MLPAAPLEALARGALCAAVLEGGPFGSRKSVNAMLRLRSALSVSQDAVPPTCYLKGRAGEPQGSATISDVGRLLLAFATAPQQPPASGVPKPEALRLLVAALKELPPCAGVPPPASTEPREPRAPRAPHAGGLPRRQIATGPPEPGLERGRPVGRERPAQADATPTLRMLDDEGFPPGGASLLSRPRAPQRPTSTAAAPSAPRTGRAWDEAPERAKRAPGAAAEPPAARRAHEAGPQAGDVSSGRPRPGSVERGPIGREPVARRPSERGLAGGAEERAPTRGGDRSGGSNTWERAGREAAREVRGVREIRDVREDFAVRRGYGGGHGEEDDADDGAVQGDGGMWSALREPARGGFTQGLGPSARRGQQAPRPGDWGGDREERSQRGERGAREGAPGAAPPRALGEAAARFSGRGASDAGPRDAAPPDGNWGDGAGFAESFLEAPPSRPKAAPRGVQGEGGREEMPTPWRRDAAAARRPPAAQGGEGEVAARAPQGGRRDDEAPGAEGGVWGGGRGGRDARGSGKRREG